MFVDATYPFQNRLSAFNPLCLPSPQHHPDRDIGEEEKKKIAALYKGHAVIIQQVVFVSRYLKQLGMYRVARISAEEEEYKPERNEDNAYDKAPDQNTGKDFQIAYET